MYIKDPRQFLNRRTRFRNMVNVPEEWRGCEVLIEKIAPLKAKIYGDSRDFMGKGYVYVPELGKDNKKRKPPVRKILMETNLGFLRATRRKP